MGEGSIDYPCKYQKDGCKDRVTKPGDKCIRCEARDIARKNRSKYKHKK